MDSRAALLASFFASCRAGVRAEGLILNAASVAGMLLHQYRTAHEALDACRRMPMGAVWARAAELLAEVASDEQADTVPPVNVMSEGGVGR